MPKLDEQTQRARREHILDAAERCFAREGFHRSSMQDICREAAISPGALYLYFTSKEDLIAGICERERTHFAHALSSVAEAPDFMAALSQLAQAYCVDEPEEKLRLHLEINAEALRNPAIGKTVREIDAFVIDSFRRLLDGARARRRIDPALDSEMVAQILSVLGDGIFLRRAIDPAFDVKACLPVVLSVMSFLIKPVEITRGGNEFGARG
jgi:AcrR family transcriptional regulator